MAFWSADREFTKQQSSKLAVCVTPDEMLRVLLIFGISDTKVGERLLWESDLTATKTDEMCHTPKGI